MARDLINRYIWLIDTIRRYGRITLDEINRQWLRSQLSDGKPLPRRTFHHYRNDAEQMFGVNIQCDRSTYEYYIEETSQSALQQWLVDSTALTDTLRDTSDIAGRVVLENVPSARDHLATIIDAMRQNHRIRFSYRSYTRRALFCQDFQATVVCNWPQRGRQANQDLCPRPHEQPCD